MGPKSASKLPPAIAMAAVIRSIPRGKVSTYGAVAEAAGYPRSARLEQRFLLESEGVRFRGRKVDMALSEFRFAKPKKARKTTARRAPSR